MLVVKKDSSWTPAENHALKVGETIEITDPSILLANGTVEAYVEPEPEPTPEPVIEEKTKSTKTKI